MGARRAPSVMKPSQFYRVQLKVNNSSFSEITAKARDGRVREDWTYREGDVLELHAISRSGALAAPILINIQPIRRVPRNKVLQIHILHRSASTVGLDHEDLVASVRVHISVEYILDGGVGAKRADGRASGLVAPDLLDLDVVRGGLDGDAFVAVGDFDVVDPVVRTPDVDTVGTAEVSSTNDRVVHFTVRAVLNDKVELGS